MTGRDRIGACPRQHACVGMKQVIFAEDHLIQLFLRSSGAASTTVLSASLS